MSFTPYTESDEPGGSLAVSRQQATVTSGMSTTVIDRFRQGVELITNKHRFLGPVKICADSDSSTLLVNTYGRPKSHDDSTIYGDYDTVKPLDLIHLSASLDENRVLDGVVEEYPDLLDGAIEPLSIRRPSTFTSIDSPFEAHDIRADVQAGNHTIARGSDLVFDMYVINGPKKFDPFFDAAESFGSASHDGITAPMPLVDLFFDDLKIMRVTGSVARDDVERAANIGNTLNVLCDKRIEGVLRAMHVISSSDQGVHGLESVSSTAGFVYAAPALNRVISSSSGNVTSSKEMVRSYGTDSIAFGGLIQ